MAKIVSLLVTPATLALGLAAFGWLDGFHCTIAGISLLIAGMVRLFAHPKDAQDRPLRGKLDRGRPDYPLSRAQSPATIYYYRNLLGVMRGVLLLAVVILASSVASLIPGLQALVLDRDRAEIELRLEALEQAHDWSAAADLIASRLERRASQEWRRALLVRFYDSLIAAGTAASKEDAQAFFERASDLAEQEGLNNDLATTHLERLNLRGALDRQTQTTTDLAQKDSQREAEVKRMNAQVADSQRENRQLQTQLLASRSEAEQLRLNITQVHAEMAQARTDRARAELQMLIEWGDSLQAENPLHH